MGAGWPPASLSCVTPTRPPAGLSCVTPTQLDGTPPFPPTQCGGGSLPFPPGRPPLPLSSEDSVQPSPCLQKIQFSRSVESDSVTPWTAAHQASLSNTNPQSPPKLMSIESVMPSNLISSSVVPFSSCLQSFPASGSFLMSQLFPSGGQSIGVSASASVLPMNIQDSSPLGWTGWISLQSKGLSRVFSNITVRKHQFFGAQLSLWSNSHIHT